MSSMGRIKVVYIAGWGRSGSTILGNILGQAYGYHFGGELQYVWQRGFLEDGECGCGKKFHGCDFWGNVTREISDSQPPVDSTDMSTWTNEFTRTVQFPRLAAGFLRGRRFAQYLSGLENLYSALHRTTGGKIIVDSSKSPVYALAIGLIPSVDLYFVHVVRDARAVAFSYGTRKVAKDPSRPIHLAVRGPFFTSAMWMVWNLIAEIADIFSLVRYHRLRYEDFASEPQKQIDRITMFCGTGTGRVAIGENGQVELAVNHSASGNPSRFEVGTIRIVPDVRWKTSMAASVKWLIGLITWPLLLRYRYVGGRSE
jgi:hypothetical protein